MTTFYPAQPVSYSRSHPLTPPGYIYGHPDWSALQVKKEPCGQTAGAEEYLDEYYDDGCSPNPSPSVASTLSTSQSFAPGPSRCAQPLSAMYYQAGAQPMLVPPPPVTYTSSSAPSMPVDMAQEGLPPVYDTMALPSLIKGKAKMDMNLAPAGSMPATAGYKTPLAQYVATMVVWLWYGDYLPESRAGQPVASSSDSSHPGSIASDPFEVRADTKPLNRLQVTPSQHFINQVARILQVTNVSHSVTIIALLYIYRLKRQRRVPITAGTEFRPFIASLILGNKYLDDNTYTNKTWSELTQLPVTDIRDMEVEFLRGLNYNLSVQHSEYLRWRQIIDGFMMANQRLKGFAAQQQQQQQTHISPPMPLSQILTPAQPLPLAPAPRAYSASPPFTGIQAFTFPPVSPAHARKRSREDAFVPGGQSVDPSMVYESLRLPPRKASFAPTSMALAMSSTSSTAEEQDRHARTLSDGSSVKRATSLNRRIARLPASGARRGSAGQLLAQAPEGDLRHAAAAHVQRDWMDAMDAEAQHAYHALVAPCTVQPPQYIPPEHLQYYALAATPHLGQDGHLRKARLRYQAYALPGMYTGLPQPPTDSYTYGFENVSMSDAPGAVAFPQPLVYQPQSTAGLPDAPLVSPPYSTQPEQYHIPFPDASNYAVEPLPGQFANAGPPAWTYDPYQMQVPSQAGQYWPRPAYWPSEVRAQPDQPFAPHGLQAMSGHQANRLSTGSEEMLAANMGGAGMGNGTVTGWNNAHGAWRTRSEWSSPMLGWNQAGQQGGYWAPH